MAKKPAAESAAAVADNPKARAAAAKLAALAEREVERAEARAQGKTLAGLVKRVDALEHFVKKIA